MIYHLAFPIIERFTVLMYKRKTNTIIAEEALREMFVKNGSDLGISPTYAILLEHIFRAAYMAGHK